MPMIIKSYTVSAAVSERRETNGVPGSKTVWSEGGLQAELMLLPKGSWKVHNKPDRAHLSVRIDIDRVPNDALTDMDAWLRTQLIEMLEDDEEQG